MMFGALSSSPIVSVLPFATLLAGIATLPLIAHRVWERNRNKALFAFAVSVPAVLQMLAVRPENLVHAALEYVSFVTLLGSLFVVAGGIHLAGDLRGTPARNTAFLIVGAVFANLVGTTGASMVLIRPLLRTNRQRAHVAHIPIFFILLVSNCGGLLTPLGDPPLFLGYLRGVPFSWTLRLWPAWLGVTAYLATLFYFIDRRAYRKESTAAISHDASEVAPLRVVGALNVLLLSAIALAVFLGSPYRELTMATCAILSLVLGPRLARTQNEFSYEPLVEVAILFAGIFATMGPALSLLHEHGSRLGVREPWQFFIVTGGLSSVLDNAPTYLTFLSTAQSLGLRAEVVGISDRVLAAISCGAVFMGANTYIGNGPNFMVKAIAEKAGYDMPSFARYAALAVAILAPVYVALALFFVG